MPTALSQSLLKVTDVALSMGTIAQLLSRLSGVHQVAFVCRM